MRHVLSAVIVSFGISAASFTAAGQSPAVEARADFRQIVSEAKARVFPAVVYIRCVREVNDRGEKAAQEVSGSGVITTPAGEVVTNWHVVDKAKSVRCLLSDGQAMPARVLGSDKDTDLAVLQLELPPGSAPLPHAAFGESGPLKEGDFVMAMGAPWGLNRSVSIGIISCTRRYLDGTGEYTLWLQTDAPINPGNSGGPLVNTDGRVIGINTRGMNSADGMGFAIPSDTVRIVVPQLRDHGQVDWSWFGLQLQPLRDFNRDVYFDATEGVMVAETDPSSPARTAGVLAKDRIVKINGEAITGLTAEDLPTVRRRLGLLPKGKPAEFEIVRDGKLEKLSITPREKGRVEGEEYPAKRWDLTFKAINQFDNPELFFYQEKGVYVLATKYPGNASNSGLRAGDIVTKIDGQEVETLADIERMHKAAVEKVKDKPKLVFTLLRAGSTRQIVLDFSRDFSKE